VSDDGQALVEFSLVLPVILVLAVAIVQLAELGVARLALEHAAAEGARAGALTNDDELIRDSVAAAVAPLDPDEVTVEIEPSGGQDPRNADPRGSLLHVRVRYALPVPLGFTGLPRFVVHGSAARRVEWTP